MKRDFDLVRKLLLFFDASDGEPVEVPPIGGYDTQAIKYHLVLLYDAGFLRCEPVNSRSGERLVYVLPFELTWAGHELLDTIRAPFVWDEVLATLQRVGLASASIEIVKQLAERAIRKRLEGT